MVGLGGIMRRGIMFFGIILAGGFWIELKKMVILSAGVMAAGFSEIFRTWNL